MGLVNRFHGIQWAASWSLLLGAVLLCSCSQDPLSEAREEAFDKADDKVSPPNGEVASGNSEQAQAIAATVSSGLQKLQQEMFTGASFNHEGDEFLTHCRINEAEIVFLIHVPNLGDYESEAKELIRALCWNTPQAVLAGAGEEFTAGKKLVVGIRGNFLYDTVLKADSIQEFSIDQMEKIGSEVERTSGQRELWEYFLDKEREAEIRQKMKENPS